MQRLGKTLHISPSRNIIVEIENMPRIGETIVDENLKPVGRVFDIFGPVTSPYTSLKTTTPQPERLINKMLYTLPSKRRKE